MRDVQELKSQKPGDDPLTALGPETQAEVMWTSAQTLKVFEGHRELCWLVGSCIRYGCVCLLTLLMQFIKALNQDINQPRAQRFQPRPQVPWDMLYKMQLFRGGGFDGTQVWVCASVSWASGQPRRPSRPRPQTMRRPGHRTPSLFAGSSISMQKCFHVTYVTQLGHRC